MGKEEDLNDRELKIKWRAAGESTFQARNVVFEGSWLIFYDIFDSKIHAFPFDLIEEVKST